MNILQRFVSKKELTKLVICSKMHFRQPTSSKSVTGFTIMPKLDYYAFFMRFFTKVKVLLSALGRGLHQEHGFRDQQKICFLKCKLKASTTASQKTFELGKIYKVRTRYRKQDLSGNNSKNATIPNREGRRVQSKEAFYEMPNFSSLTFFCLNINQGKSTLYNLEHVFPNVQIV